MVTCEQLDYDTSQDIRTGNDYGIATQLCTSLLGEQIGSVGIDFATGSTITDGTISCCRWANVGDLNQSSAANLLSAANHTFWSADATTVGTGMYNPASQNLSDATLGNDHIGVVITGSTGTTVLKINKEATNPTSRKSYKMKNGSPSGSGDFEAWALTYTIATGSAPPASGGTFFPPPPAMVRL